MVGTSPVASGRERSDGSVWMWNEQTTLYRLRVTREDGVCGAE